MLFEELLKGLSSDPSAGDPSIESSPAFSDLKLALDGKQGKQMGDAEIAGVAPDYPRAVGLASELLGESKHLSLLAALCKAGTGAHGFSGLYAGLQVSREVLSKYWSNIFPVEDKEDADDPWWGRVNYLREVASDPLISSLLYDSTIVDVKRIGNFSLRDIDIAAGRREATDEEMERCNPGLIRAAFDECDSDALKRTSDSFDGILRECDALDLFIAEHISAEQVSFQNLKNIVGKYQTLFQEYAQDALANAVEETPAIENRAQTDDGSDSDSPQDAQISPIQGIQAKKDVVNTRFTERKAVLEAFDDVIAFYREHEPSSPVPILVSKAREMVHKNFFDILRDLAPQKQLNFKELTSALKEDPLRFLMVHSYESFTKNEAVVNGSDSNVSGSVSSRDDVVQTLKDIQSYYEVHEPSSPVPLILRKVRTLVTKSFLDLLAEFEAVGDEEKKPAKVLKKKAANNEAS